MAKFGGARGPIDPDSATSMTRDDIEEIVDRCSPAELEQLIRTAMRERVNRAIDNHDPETLALAALESGFNQSGNPVPPQVVAPGVVALISVVKDLGKVKHRCTQYTVKADRDAPEEFWSWDDENHTYIYSDTAKVGEVRRSVALHAPPSGALIIQHTMKHDGERHERTAVKSWEVEVDFDHESGEPRVQLTPSQVAVTKLPPPNNDRE